MKARRPLWAIFALALLIAACGPAGGPGGDGGAPSPEAATPPPTSAPPTEVATPTQEAAQSCDAVIAAALEAIDAVCAGVGRNQACYGHNQVTATLRGGASGEFDSPSDTIELAALARLETSAYDPDGDLWGIAMLKMQADLPETLPGQAITLIAYGETTIEDASEDGEGAAPMSTVYINTGLGEPACEDAPPPGVLLQNGSGEVASLTVNGVDLVIGSTVFIQAQSNRDMVLAVLEGQVDAFALGQRVVAVAGAQVRVPLGGPNGLLAREFPRLEALDLRPLQRLNLPALRVFGNLALPRPLDRLELERTRQPLLEFTRPAIFPTRPSLQITPPGILPGQRERGDGD